MTKSQSVLISMSVLAVAAAILTQGSGVAVVFGWILLVFSVLAGAVSFLSVLAERPAWADWPEDKARYCEKCGLELADNENVCPECGTPFEDEYEDEEEDRHKEERGEDDEEAPPEQPGKGK